MGNLENGISNTGSFFFTGGPHKKNKSISFRKLLAMHDGSPLELDAVALTEFPARYTFLGDRTLFKEVKRTQWSIDGHNANVKLSPKHGQQQASSLKIAKGLYPLLKSEVTEYIEKNQHVGILLSGGMDSRIVAGILKKIQHKTNGFKITAFTWGHRNSRDPVYANRITNSYNWDFEHFDITAATLRRNIAISAKEGCFYSAQHLHAMKDVAERAKELKVDCILAGSYGNGIGRAVYSGKRIEKLVPISKTLRNWFQLINSDIYLECQNSSHRELNRYHELFNYKQNSPIHINELDQLVHYWRNQLGSCMATISTEIPLKQVFTSNAVVNFIWSFASAYRTDDIYTQIFKLIDPELLKVPDAKTGKPYMVKDVSADNLCKGFHSYLSWIHNDLKDYLKDIILSGDLKNTGVFNMRQIEALLATFYKNKPMAGRLPEIILWLGAVSLFLDKYKWIAPSICAKPTSEKYSLIGAMELHAYAIRHRLFMQS